MRGLPHAESGAGAGGHPAGFDSELTWSSSGTGSDAAFPGSGTTRLQPGQEFGRRYTIIRLLGSGGMGEVYHAWDGSLGAAVALKLIRVDPGAPALERRDLEARFKRELKLRAKSRTQTSSVFTTSARSRARSTSPWRCPGSGSRYPAPAGADAAADTSACTREADCLRTRVAHRAGIVHRDLKPANVMVDALGHAQLMDFGIARSTSAGSVHTMPGSVVGTMDYMAPEQARGEPADERADVYAFGLILYRAPRRRSAEVERGRRAVEPLGTTGERAAGSADGTSRRFTRPRADCEQVPVFERGGTLPVRQRAPRRSRSARRQGTRTANLAGAFPLGSRSRRSCCSALA